MEKSLLHKKWGGGGKAPPASPLPDAKCLNKLCYSLQYTVYKINLFSDRLDYKCVLILKLNTCNLLIYQEFNATSDSGTLVTNHLPSPIVARYVRLYLSSGRRLRFDVIGCEGKYIYVIFRFHFLTSIVWYRSSWRNPGIERCTSLLVTLNVWYHCTDIGQTRILSIFSF